MKPTKKNKKVKGVDHYAMLVINDLDKMSKEERIDLRKWLVETAENLKYPIAQYAPKATWKLMKY